MIETNNLLGLNDEPKELNMENCKKKHQHEKMKSRNDFAHDKKLLTTEPTEHTEKNHPKHPL